MLYTKLKHRVKDLKELAQMGVVSPNWLRDIDIFESFHNLPEDLCVYCKYEVVAEEFGISSDSVKKIISKLKR